VNQTPFPSSRRRLRRLAVLATGALLGLGGVLAIAAPASAHHPIVTGSAHCETSTGDWIVDWEVANSESDLTGKLTDVTLEPAGTTVTNIVVGATLPVSGDGPLKGVQRVAANETGAKLTVDAEWWRNGNHITSTKSGEVTFAGSCEEDHALPTASTDSACDGSVAVTLANAKDATKSAKFTVEGAKGFSVEKTVAPGEQVVVNVPAESATDITISADGKVLKKDSWKQPADCELPSVGVESTCDELIISLENPEGVRPLEATLTPKGGEAQKVTVAPGETKEVKFDATEGTVVTLTIGDESADIPWEKPDDCQSPSPSPAPGAGGGGPTLPTTGASIGTAVGIAAVLLAAGTGLFFFFRRRRIRFTA
jgi:LPXTG-motif cell wall-anchored protein